MDYYYSTQGGYVYAGDMQKGDRKATADEIGSPIEHARKAKLAEIVARANAVKAALSASYSVLEESTWAQQEAGARSILNDAASVKDDTAALILTNAARTAAAVALVNELAEKDGSAPEGFAARIAANADASHQAGILTLLEQRGYESAAKKAGTVEEMEAIEVVYSVAALLS